MKRKDGGVRKEGRDVVCVVAPDLMCRRAAVRTHFLGVALTDGARFSGSSPDLWPHMHSASGPFRSTEHCLPGFLVLRPVACANPSAAAHAARI